MSTASRGRALVPAWLDVLAAVAWRVLATVALGLVLLFIAGTLATVTASILVALIVAAALAPLVQALRARGLGASLAAAIACLAGAVVIGVVTLTLAWALIPSLLDLIAAIGEGIRDLREQLASLGLPPEATAAVDDLFEAIRALVQVEVSTFVGPIATVVTVCILGGFLTYFLLQGGDLGWAWLMRPLDPWRQETLTASAQDGLERVGGYLLRTAVLAATDAVIAAVVLVGLGVQLAGPLVVLVFLGGFVPFLGALVTTTIVGLVTLALVGPMAALVAVLVITVATVIQTRLLAGTRLGSKVDVHPVQVLVAIPAGALLFGFLGLLAVLPVTVFVLAISRSVLVALEPATPDPSAPGGADGPVHDGSPAVASALAIPAGVPAWLDRLGQWSWRGLLVVAVVALLIAIVIRIPAVVVPIVLAVVLAATLAPVAGRLRRAGWSPSTAAFAATAGGTLVVVAALALSVAGAVRPLREIIATALDGADETALDWLLVAVVDGVGDGLLDGIGSLLGSVIVVVATVLLALLLVFFFIRDAGWWWRGAISRLDGRRRAGVDVLGTRAVSVLSGYMIGTALIALFGAVTSALIMVILGLPLAVPIGVLTFFGGFIPYIGGFVTTAMAVLIAVAVGTTTDVVIMLIYTVVFNIVQGNFVTPLVYGRTLSLHPAVILLAIPAGNEVAGILGMFLVVPFVAIVAATWRTALETIDPHAPEAAMPTELAGSGEAAMPAGAAQPAEPASAVVAERPA
jgi:predicted PurR-regulated permease PerM